MKPVLWENTLVVGSSTSHYVMYFAPNISGSYNNGKVSVGRSVSPAQDGSGWHSSEVNERGPGQTSIFAPLHPPPYSYH